MVILTYIAGRFSATDRAGVERNIAAAEEVAIEVASAGYAPICPHTNTRHPKFERVQTYDFWIAATMAMLERCDALVTVPGWEASKGACGEVKRMLELGRPVAHSVGELIAEFARRAQVGAQDYPFNVAAWAAAPKAET